jgi:MtaA/CmuA family methyltransferase
MNGLERCLAVLNGGLPDCVPVVPENYLFAIRHCGYRMKDVVYRGELLAECLLRTREAYGYDGVTVDLDNAVSAESLGCKVEFRDDEPAVVKTPVIMSLDDVEHLALPKEKIPGRWKTYADCVSALSKRIGHETLITAFCDQGPFSLAGLVRGMEDFLIDLANPEARDRVHRLLETCRQVTERFGLLLIEAGAHVVVFGDALASPDVVSPAIYREFAFPYEKQVVAHLKGKGRFIGIHICGNVTSIFQDLVATGADLLDIDYKTDLHHVRNVCRKRPVIRGTLDPAGVLRFGSPRVVEEKCRQVIDLLGQTGNLILSGGCDIGPDTPPENLRTMVRVAHAHLYGKMDDVHHGVRI